MIALARADCSQAHGSPTRQRGIGINSPRLRVGFLVLSLLTFSGHVSAAESTPPETAAAENLANWINSDVGLCLEIDQIADECRRFGESALYDRLKRFRPLAQAWQRHKPGLVALAGEVQRRTGATPLEIGRRLLGRKVLFAIWPPLNPATDKPEALVLIDAPDEQFMRRTLEKLVAARKQGGRWKESYSLTVGATSITVDVVVPDEGPSQFFIASSGKLAALSTSRDLLRAAFERRASDDRTSSLSELPAYQAANERLSRQVVARLWVNPRIWAPSLEADVKRKTPGSEEARTQAALVEIWKATEYAAAGLHLAPRLGLELASQWNAAAFPAAAREAVQIVAGGSRMIEQIPADALLAVAGHADFGRLIRSLIANQWQETANAAQPGTDIHPERILFWALSAGLGPDCGFWVERNQSFGVEGAEQLLPITVIAGIATQPLVPDHSRAALAQNIEPLLHALVAAGVESVNRREGKQLAAVRSSERAGTIVTSISGLVPGKPQQEFAYAVDRQHWLWFGTAAAGIERAALAATTDGLRSRLADRLPFSAGGSPGTLIYVNLVGWRKLASLGRPAFEFLWEGKRIAEKAKDEQFQSFVAVSEMANALLVTSTVDETGLRAAIEIE